MRISGRLIGICLLSSLSFVGMLAFAQQKVRSGEGHVGALPIEHAAADMARAAEAFLAALSADQRQKATFDLKDEERFNWHFVPRARKGLPFKEMTPAQRQLAHALLSSGLSQRGYLTTMTIMSLEQILHETENQNPRRDPELYYLSIFGKPGANETWGWRVEGHHLSLNFTLAGGKAIAASPSFFGSNPAKVPGGPRAGLRALDREEDLGRELIKSLNEQQRKTAIIAAAAPADIITGASRKVTLEEPAGLPAADMTDEQKELLMALVQTYAFRHRPEVAAEDMRKIHDSGLEKLHFAWAGGLEPGQGHYYRVQGPTFLLEYDNTQNNANHVHSVWRDPANDFGEDVLRRHYEAHPHGDASR